MLGESKLICGFVTAHGRVGGSDMPNLHIVQGSPVIFYLISHGSKCSREEVKEESTQCDLSSRGLPYGIFLLNKSK